MAGADKFRQASELKFHFLAEAGYSFETSLGSEPLRFIKDTQDIRFADGSMFKHSLRNLILELIRNCGQLGDCCTRRVECRMNILSTKYEWGNPSDKGMGFVWVRVFEVGSERIRGTEEIKHIFVPGAAKSKYWKSLEGTLLSVPEGMDVESAEWVWVRDWITSNLVQAQTEILRNLQHFMTM